MKLKVEIPPPEKFIDGEPLDFRVRVVMLYRHENGKIYERILVDKNIKAAQVEIEDDE